MSSLARQLQGIASLDSSRLTSRTGAPLSKSYLFTPTEAAQQDLDEVYQIGVEGFTELVELDPDMMDFGEELFSDVSKRIDRMMMTQQENEELDEVLARCLRRLGRWVGVMACGRCLEWLVRRFRIHEMNADTILQVFLPYHESPNFARMLSILTIPTSSPYHAPFAPLIKDAQPLPRSYIATAISPAKEPSLRLLRDVVGMVQVALDQGVVHRAMLNFWSATIVELLEKKNLSEGLVKALVEAFVWILSTPEAGQDVNAAVYPPLVLLTRSVRLADGPFLAILSALLTPSTGANPAQRILTLLIVLEDGKGWTGGLGENGAEWISKIKLLGETLEAGMAKYGFESALTTILPVMVERPDLNSKHFRPLIESPALTPALASILAGGLISHQSSNIETTRTTSEYLLIALRERHPAVVDKSIMTSNAQNVVPLALQSNLTNAEGFADVYGADVAGRIRGIGQMYDMLKSGSTASQSSAKEALKARLADGELPVIQAIYARPDEAVQALQAEYTEVLRPVFVAEKQDVEVMRCHIRFIDAFLLPAKPELAETVAKRLIFPCLLSTADRQIFTQEEWKALGERGIGGLDLIKGVRTAVLGSADPNLVQLNKLVIQGLSETVYASNGSERWTEFLLSTLTSPFAAESVLSQSVLAHILSSPSKQKISLALACMQQVEALISSVRIQEVTAMERPAGDDLLEAVSADINNSVAQARVVLSLLGEISRTVRPKEAIDWLGVGGFTNTSVGEQYSTLATHLYKLANCGRLHTKVSSQLLRTLFTQIGEDALIFFASIWSTPASPAPLRVTALRHALAFVNAYNTAKATGGVDLQMIVPTLIVALQDESKEVRSAGVAVLKAVSGLTKGQEDVYAVNTFYGTQTKLVQLLKPAYLDRYLSALLPHASEIILDPRRIISLHAQFGPQSTQDKKDKGINRAIIASLFSHISAWRDLKPRMALLACLTGIQDTAVLKGVMPLLSPLIDDDSEEGTYFGLQKEDERETYLAVLLSSLNRQTASLLGSTEGEAWTFFEGALTPPAKSRFATQIRSMSLQRMTEGVFDALPHAQKIAYTLSLVRSLHTISSEQQFSTRASLKLLNLDATAVISILTDLVAPFEISGGKKRQRQEETTEMDKHELAVLDMTVLLESRDWATMPGNSALVAALMNALSALLAKRQAVKEGVDYLEQELLGAILALVEKITDPVEVTKAHIGIEAIIKTIRSTSNPRTSQRALLVAAELARLIPDTVLHNVMPIFTFMGAADFQRDDAYSFGVVERTVKGIVPVLVGKLRQTAGSGIALWNASASFISIFTDMAGRLPKHRTLPFFSHLVDALGRTDFLAPISMLLIDRSTAKAGKSGNSAAQAIDLALGVATSSNGLIKLNVILDIIKEVGRLLSDLPNSEQTAFLSQFSTDTDDQGRTLRRATSLLTFSTALAFQLVGKPADQDLVQAIVRELVKQSASAKSPTVEHSDVPQSLHRCLGESMKLLSAENFLGVVRELSDSADQEDVVRALDLFAERLPLIKKEVRLKSTSAIAAIIRRSADLLNAMSSTVKAALTAIRAVTISALPAEDSALAAIMPKLIDPLKGSDTGILNEVLSLLEVSTRHLGPRIIPSIQPTLTAALSLISRPTTSASTAKASFIVISSLIETVPTFIGARQLSTILRAGIDNRAKHEESSSALISVCAKKIPTKVLFPVVMDLWKEVQKSGESTLEGFFHLLRLTLRNADRAVLPGLTKTIFAFFLDVFDLRHRLQARALDMEVITRIEESAIGSFLELVTKLNEAAFKPLFTRLYDWAVIDLSEGKSIDDQRPVERKTVLLHVMMGLLTKFRHLLSPYIGILLPHIEELLSAFSRGVITDISLWTLLIRVLGKSFEVDDGAYWTEALYLRLIPLLTAQINVFPGSILLIDSPLSLALSSLAGSTTSEPILKALNNGICRVTRDESVRVRLAALRCLDAVWEKQVEEMVGLVPETVSEYLAELIEDENTDVEVMARGVLGRIERVTGSLKEYLE